MRFHTIPVLALISLFSIAAVKAAAQTRWSLDLENGAAISGYNDVRIPNETGTLFSLTDDLDSETAYFWRVRLETKLADRHAISVLAAPLTIKASGSFDRAVSFVGSVFAPGVPIQARYVFNSYRVTYRYDLVRRGTWRFGIGVTGKVRDAVTRLETAGLRAEKTNVGFVPLVNFSLERRVGERATLQLTGDAAVAPQGRAEDIFAGVVVPVGQHLAVKGGYRLLEGGADVDEVYTFAAIHYLALGAIVRF
jgi:hypothetical protein